MEWTEEQREEVARILEMVAEEGLPHPRNLDAALDAISCTTFDGMKPPITIDMANAMPMLMDEKLMRKANQLLAPALVEANPFNAIASIIDATVFDEHQRKLLEHNLGIFQTKLKGAQHAH